MFSVNYFGVKKALLIVINRNKKMNEKIKIHVLHCGMVYTPPYPPYDIGGVGLLKVADFGFPKKY